MAPYREKQYGGYANKMDMGLAKPHSDLASTKYCLANPGVDYLIYLPDGGKVTVDLSAASGMLAVEWFNPNTDETISAEAVAGGNSLEFAAPFSGDAVLYIAVSK